MIFPPGVWLMIAAHRARRRPAALHPLRPPHLRHRLQRADRPPLRRPVRRTKLLIYIVGLAFAGVAGVLQFSYLTVGDPTTANGLELDVIAAVVIGGASLNGGEGSVFGSLIGALIMTVVANGCTKMDLANWVQEIVTGGIIIAAVVLDRWRHRSAQL